MCGIATIAIGRSSRGRIPYPLLRSLTAEMLVQLGSRGLDASGIAVVNEDETFVFKKPLRPSRLVVRPKFQEVLSQIGPRTNFILLHSRAASVGGNTDNFNNHPIVAPPVIGVHNGTLYNSDTLFRRYRDHFGAQGSVDSEVIFRLWRFYLTQGVTPHRAMQLVSKQLMGAFTGAAIDTHKPNRMVLFKFRRPLALLSLRHYDMLVAVSEPRFYDRAKERAKIKPKDVYTQMKEETGLLLDVNAGRIVGNLNDFRLPVKAENRREITRWESWANFAY